MSESQNKGNVEQLSNYRLPNERWEKIKSHVTEFANQDGDNAAVAIAGVSIKANGEISVTAMNVEPEHVVPMVAALNRLVGELMRFLGRS